MKKTILGIALVLMTLGCTGTTDTGDGAQPTQTILSLALEESSIAAGFSTTATATITNNWAKDMPVGDDAGTLFLLPDRTDITFDPTEQSITNIITNTGQTFYTTIDTASNTFPNTYEIYGRFCFHYETEAQQNVIIHTGESEIIPTNSYTTGPLGVSFGGTPEINTLTQSRMTVLATINNIGNGITYDGEYGTGQSNRLNKITIVVPNDYVEVDSINNFGPGTVTDEGVTKTFVWDSNIRMVSDRLQISIPMNSKADPPGETERPIRMTIEYDYCVDSNRVSLAITRQ